ncbi:MAG TPA: hypothetical protein VE177_01520 [Candidatus Binatus sp.]|nr:hypothetical protein [Candidatus Binatus sp.]
MIVNEYDPTVPELQERVAVPELDRLLGVRPVQTRPDGTLAVNPMIPMNPLIGVTVTETMAGVPAFTGEVATEEMEKSVTTNRTVVECVRVPLAPVMVTS